MIGRNSQTRRRWLTTCATLAGTPLIAGCSESSAETNREDDENSSTDDEATIAESTGTDWPMYGVDLQNTAHHPEATGPDGDDLVHRPIIDLKGGSTHPPAIVDGIIYIASTAGKTYAVDPEREEILWEREGYGAPIVHDGMLYGPTDTNQVYGYDLETGDSYEPEEIESANNVWNPMPHEGRLLVASPEPSIWEIELDTGGHTTLIEISPGLGTTDVPAYRDGMYYIARSSELYKINVETREIEWTFETEDEVRLLDSNPAVGNGMVYVNGGDQHLYGINADSGEEVWAVDTGSSIETSPAIADGLVYTGYWGDILAVDAEEGVIEWRTDDIISGEPEDIVVADGVCYVTTRFGISAHNAASGELRWKHKIPYESDAGFTAPPAITDGTMYVPSGDDETLYAIEDA